MRLALAGVAISGAALLVACGGGGSEKRNTPTAAAATTAPRTTATRPAPTSTTVPATAATVPATQAAAPPSPTLPAAPPPANTEIPPPPPPTEPPPASGGTLTVVAVNVLFDVKSLSAAAGPITIDFDNQDTSVAHNIHFFSNAGSITMTEIMTGPSTDTLSLGTLAPGAYPYKCDVHPTTMTGMLTVS